MINEKPKKAKKNKNIIGALHIWCCQHESYLALIMLALAVIYATWPVLSAPANSYPVTVDGMGHLTKIKYIADCLKDFHWPAWFPYWYSGSTVMQYYPPLSYLLLAPMQMVFDNVMITFKFFCFLSPFIGAAGVWKICRRFVGPLFGIWGGMLYALQPFILQSLLIQGLVAQGPIFALTPWFLYCTLLFLEERTRLKWMFLCLITALSILSHPMHAFLVTLGMIPLVITLLVSRRIKLVDFIHWGLAIAFGAGLAAFWWVPGVTQLETPGIPYLLPEAADNWSATLNWFNPALRNEGILYFSCSVLSAALVSILWIKKYPAKCLNQGEILSSASSTFNNGLLVPLFIALVTSILFSFGHNLPFFTCIPLSHVLVPARILTFSAVLTAILGSVFVHQVIKSWNHGYWRILGFMVIIISTAIILKDINPRLTKPIIESYVSLQDDLDIIPSKTNSFDNGRFTWVWPPNSSSAYFPMLNGFNMADGWNIEGTPHNRTIWQHNVAVPGGCTDYVIKNLLQWNVRSLFVDKRYARTQDVSSLKDALTDNGFKVLAENDKYILHNPLASSYFMHQERNALVIGRAASEPGMYFPWLVHGYSAYLEDYPYEYLTRFKLIYLIEPDVRDFTTFDNMIKDLAGKGTICIIEMGRSEIWSICDVTPYWERIGVDSVLIPSGDSPYTEQVPLDADLSGRAAAMGNLDCVWLEMISGSKHIPALGYKNVNGNKVYFVGLSLGQQLNSSHGKAIRKILEQLMDTAKPHKSITPAPFPVSKAEWSHNGFSFSYDSAQNFPVLVSVTYTPRWEARIDRTSLPVQNLENLILIDLPAGKHRVSFHYGMTWVGKMGIVISIIFVLMVIIFCLKFERFEQWLQLIRLKTRTSIENIGT